MNNLTGIYRLTFLFFLIIFLGNNFSVAQESILVEGFVSYISGQNIYVRFSSTAGIENGDTLFIKKNNTLMPALIVQHHSSTSCLCVGMDELTFEVNKPVFIPMVKKREQIQENIQYENLPEKDVSEQILTTPKTEKKSIKQDLLGSIRISSYSNFNSSGENLHRFRYTVSAKASNISESKLSAETYISFTHRLNEWNLVQQNLNHALKIYSLALKYDFNESTFMWAGRKINPRIANLGAIDGLQFEYGFKNMVAGVIAGSRPGFQDYGYNLDLFEYGGYLGHNQKGKHGFLQTSLALIEQRNTGKVDRRFAYLQHTNSLLNNFNLFSSVEFDLYHVENGISANAFILTSLYLSVNYRFSRKLAMFGSYDNRKNVIYYETFRNYPEEVLQQASRQGLRFRINYRPANYLIVSMNAGTRFRENDPRPTKTLNGSVTCTRIPTLNALLNVSANLMQTSYLDGQIYGVRLAKDILPAGKIHSTIQYRLVNFKYLNRTTELNQNIGEVDISFQFNKNLLLSVNFESTFQQEEKFNRLYLSLRNKF